MSAHFGSTNSQFDWTGSYQPIYPPVPNYSASCTANLDYDTLPPDYVKRNTILGPSSLKHLYRGPQWYPPQHMSIPADTLYGFDSSVYEPNGKRRTYGKKLYPFTQKSPREVIGQSTEILPMPDIYLWTKYRTLTDGAWGR
jgi:hypothetical protein